jgi:hypothetical protein
MLVMAAETATKSKNGRAITFIFKSVGIWANRQETNVAL